MNDARYQPWSDLGYGYYPANVAQKPERYITREQYQSLHGTTVPTVQNSDTRRCDWLEKTGASVSCVDYHGIRWFTVVADGLFSSAATMREAIDNAMGCPRRDTALHDRADDDASG